MRSPSTTQSFTRKELKEQDFRVSDRELEDLWELKDHGELKELRELKELCPQSVFVPDIAVLWDEPALGERDNPVQTHPSHRFKCVLSAYALHNMHCKYVNICLCIKNDWGKPAGGQRNLVSPPIWNPLNIHCDVFCPLSSFPKKKIPTFFHS